MRYSVWPPTHRHTPRAYGVHMARVKVEKATGAVTVTDYIAVHDVGRVMNRMGIEGQLEGGIQMGLGYALREELAFDAAGQLRDSSLHSYRPFRLRKCPRLQTDFIEEGEPTGRHGAKSISECAVVPSAPAIINAVCDATGLDIHDLPYRPEKTEGRHTAAAHHGGLRILRPVREEMSLWRAVRGPADQAMAGI